MFKSVSVLSGGEKVRLVLLLLMLEEPELLVLDEPTNHLDIDTKNIVEDVFDEFDGPILFISHDRYFINKVATKIVWLKQDGPIVFAGDYDEFKASMAAADDAKPTRPVRIKTPNAAAEIRRLESLIDSTHLRMELLKQTLFEEAVYSSPETYRETMDKIHAMEAEIDGLFTKIAAIQD